MPLHCTIRPNRKAVRHWTAKAAARAVCSALDHGAARGEIEALIKTCDKAKPNKEKSAAEAFAEAEVALTDSNAIFSEQQDVLARTLQILGILVAIARVVQFIPNPAGRLSVVAVGALKVIAENQVKKIVVQKAANDSAIAVLRRAAANEAQFLQRVGL